MVAMYTLLVPSATVLHHLTSIADMDSVSASPSHIWGVDWQLTFHSVDQQWMRVGMELMDWCKGRC